MTNPVRRTVRRTAPLPCLLLVLTACAASRGLAAPQTLSDAALNSYRCPTDDLGAIYTPQATSFKLWGPTALNVQVALFDDPASAAAQRIDLTNDDHDIWSATVRGDLDGKYYLYEVTRLAAGSNQPAVFAVNDPYARGTSANTGRTLIYDPRRTDPPGWDKDQCVSLRNNVDAVLYEAHIRDFSIHTNSGTAPLHRGKYLGMVEAGRRTPQGEKSGIDHLLELGITHVHLLPVNDYAPGDETQKADAYTWYNWGYGPVLYNNLEGSYASDANGTARQKEFKQMVQAFHQKGLGVVLDVVYNHTSKTGDHRLSIFDRIIPRYYYRIDESGRYANGTHCGNELASEKPMVRKFIVDSIKYWMTEYNVDGFRFDLMGILDRETMLEAFHAAKKINPNALFYGEGWKDEQLLPAERMMTQQYVAGTGIAAFNDGIRDNIKGDASEGATPGFVQGAAPPNGGMERFRLNLKGQNTGKGRHGIPVFSPNESINYDSAHDDHCLWDKLLLSTPGASEAVRISMDKLAAGILLTAQGVPFIHAGDEFLRSKNLEKNSYNNNDPRVNPIDWSLKAQHKDVFDFYRGMLALRKAHPAFRMADRAAVDAAMEFSKAAPRNVVEFVLKNHPNGDAWKTMLVIYNGTAQSHELKVSGDWSIVANGQKAGVETLASGKDVVHVEAFSLLIAHTDGDYHLEENP